MGTLFLLFIVLPAVELALLIEIGRHIGTAATILLILATGALGAALARQQGLAVLRRLDGEMRTGQMPGDTLVEGAMVLVAAALLVTPGVLTDAFGFLCLIPATRRPLRELLQRRLARRLQRGGRHVDIHVTTGTWESRSGPIYDITPESAGGDRSDEPPARDIPPRKGS